MPKHIYKKRFAMILTGLIVWLPAVRIGQGQNAGPSAAPTPPADYASSSQPDTALPMEGSGLEELRKRARESWQKAEGDLKAQIDQTCNPDRVRTLVGRIQAARAPYDAATRNYYVYQKRLTEESLKGIQEGDTDEVYPIDDFKKDLADAQKELADKKHQRDAEAATLDSLTAKLKGGEKRDTNLANRIDAEKQLIETLDDVIGNSLGEVERRKIIVERTQNIIAEKGTLRQKWILIGELADRQIKDTDEEALAAKQGTTLYGQRRLSSCLRGSQPDLGKQ